MVKVYKVDPSDPNYCTDEDYLPEYWLEFVEGQKEHRQELMTYINEADEKGELENLSNYLTIIAVKAQGFKDFYDGYRKIIPKWQARECKYIVDMYSEILEHGSKVLKKRRSGQ